MATYISEEEFKLKLKENVSDEQIINGITPEEMGSIMASALGFPVDAERSKKFPMEIKR